MAKGKRKMAIAINKERRRAKIICIVSWVNKWLDMNSFDDFKNNEPQSPRAFIFYVFIFCIYAPAE